MSLCRVNRLIAAFATIGALVSNATAAETITKPSRISLDTNGVLVVDGKRVFPITLTIVPGPDGKTPGGKHAYAEFVDGGVSFIRTGKADWNPETVRLE